MAIESALYLVDWGPHRYNAFHLPLRVDTTHKYHAPMLCGMVFMFWVCLGQDQYHSCCAIQAPWNVLICESKHLGHYRSMDTNSVNCGVTHSKSVTLCSQSTVSCPPSWCHDNSGHRECFVFSGLGTSQVQSLPFPLACGHNTQVPCTHVVWDGLHVVVVFGAGPASFLLCHTSTVERLDLRV